MAKKSRGGGRQAPQSPRPAASSRTSSTNLTAPVNRADRRLLAVIAGIAVVVVLGGVLVVGGFGASGPSATPTPVVLAEVPAAAITPDEAAQRFAEGALLLDVREQDEWDAGHVPGAVHIPLGELAARVSEVPADRTVLVICRSGNRSQEGRDILIAAGLARVTSVEGGVRAWRDGGHPYEGSILG